MKKIVCLSPLLLLFTWSFAQFVGNGSVMGASQNFSQFLNKSLLKSTDMSANKSAAITSFNNLENTVGKRFLFDTWVSGDSVTDAQGNLINTASFVFNFDKLEGNLLATEDKINNMAVSPSGIQSFVLQDKGKPYKFEHVKAIDPLKFYVRLVKSDSGFSLYKQPAVKFIPSNFRNDGVIQTGNPNDEYKDASTYFVVNQNAGISTAINLKTKDIKETLKAQKEKVDSYFKQHKDDDINEAFLINLIDFLNH